MAPKQDRDHHAPISHEWQRWAALALLNGSDVDDVVSMMSDNGMSETAAAGACAAIYLDPVFDAARDLSAQHRKLQSLLAIQANMLNLSASAGTVEVRAKLSTEGFLDEYYARNRPVLLSDVCSAWPALSRWTPEYLGTKLAGQDVEVMANRQSDPDYEMNSDLHKTIVRFEAYAEELTAVGSSNDTYLVANNQLLATPAGASLWEDFTLDPRFLDPDSPHTRTFLWLGPKGTITPLHHDVMNVMFHQVTGRKRITLVPPSETGLVYNRVSVYSDVRLEAPDYERFPAFADAHPVAIDIEPGQALFIPVGWWHHVEALELSASVSSTAFRFPNEHIWFHPEESG